MNKRDTAAAGVETTSADVCAAVRCDETELGERYENPDAAATKYIYAMLHEAVERVDALGAVESMIEGSWSEIDFACHFVTLLLSATMVHFNFGVV